MAKYIALKQPRNTYAFFHKIPEIKLEQAIDCKIILVIDNVINNKITGINLIILQGYINRRS